MTITSQLVKFNYTMNSANFIEFIHFVNKVKHALNVLRKIPADDHPELLKYGCLLKSKFHVKRLKLCDYGNECLFNKQETMMDKICNRQIASIINNICFGGWAYDQVYRNKDIKPDTIRAFKVLLYKISH